MTVIHRLILSTSHFQRILKAETQLQANPIL
jgi:hypothetical protein